MIVNARLLFLQAANVGNERKSMPMRKAIMRPFIDLIIPVPEKMTRFLPAVALSRINVFDFMIPKQGLFVYSGGIAIPCENPMCFDLR